MREGRGVSVRARASAPAYLTSPYPYLIPPFPHDPRFQLSLAVNRLVRISPRIANLRCLRHLDVSFNRLASLPNELGSLASTLERLSCGYNELGPAFPMVITKVTLYNVIDITLL